MNRQQRFWALTILCGLVATAARAGAAPETTNTGAPSMVRGVTIDSVAHLDDIIAALSGHAKRVTARIVFDEGVPARNYLRPAERISRVAGIMGEILDSSAMKKYSVPQFQQRVGEYLETLGPLVGIWEVGNEINGEWLGDTESVVAKMTLAYEAVKAAGHPAALTLYYNQGCWAKADHEMFTWAQAHVPDRMKSGLDYVWISYYEDDCNGAQPNWQGVFDRLHAMFPNSKLGIGECGTKAAAKKADYVRRYYNLRVSTPNFVGGYFWWYYRQDAIPKSKPLWSVLDAALTGLL